MPYTGTEYLQYSATAKAAVAVGTKIAVLSDPLGSVAYCVFDTVTQTSRAFAFGSGAETSTTAIAGCEHNGRAYFVSGSTGPGSFRTPMRIREIDVESGVGRVWADPLNGYRGMIQKCGNVLVAASTSLVAGQARFSLQAFDPSGAGTFTTLLLNEPYPLNSPGSFCGTPDGKLIVDLGNALAVYAITSSSASLITTVPLGFSWNEVGHTGAIVGNKMYFFVTNSGTYGDFDYTTYNLTFRATTPSLSSTRTKGTRWAVGPDGYLYGLENYSTSSNDSVVSMWAVNPATGATQIDTLPTVRQGRYHPVTVGSKIWIPAASPLSW